MRGVNVNFGSNGCAYSLQYGFGGAAAPCYEVKPGGGGAGYYGGGSSNNGYYCGAGGSGFLSPSYLAAAGPSNLLFHALASLFPVHSNCRYRGIQSPLPLYSNYLFA